MLSFTSQEQAHTPLPGWGFLGPWVLRTPLPSSRLGCGLLDHLPSVAWVPGPESSSTMASNKQAPSSASISSLGVPHQGGVQGSGSKGPRGEREVRLEGPPSQWRCE